VETSLSELYKLLRQYRFEMIAFPVFKFWEEVLSYFEIANTKADISFVQLNNKRLPLKENILVKSIQLSESAEILINVYLKKKDQNDRNTSKISHDDSSIHGDHHRVGRKLPSLLIYARMFSETSNRFVTWTRQATSSSSTY
jgi:hypothetical protein